MTPHSTQHSTVVFGRVFDAPLARVYAAFSDPAERTRLGSAGRKAVFKLDRMDFRIGGSDDLFPRMPPYAEWHNRTEDSTVERLLT